MVAQIHLISGIDGRLPFSVEDANRPESEGDSAEVQYNRVLLETRLNNRVIDLRVCRVIRMDVNATDNGDTRHKPTKLSSNFKPQLEIYSAIT